MSDIQIVRFNDVNFRALNKGAEFTEAEKADRLEHADTIFGWFTEVANKHGYAIARHGTGVRDIDLVAIPWTEDAVSPSKLVLKLCSTFVLTMGNYAYDKPHGRGAFAMWDKDYPDHQIDLSVMPLKRADT